MSSPSLMRQFCLSQMFVVVCQVVSSTPVNKTTADGKVFITGDHNEVILSTSQETKKTLAEIKSKLDSLNEKDDKFTKRILSMESTVESLEEHMGRKQDLMNKSNAALSAQVKAMSQRLTTLENQDKLDAINETVKALSQTVGALKDGIEKNLDLIYQSTAALSVQVQEMSQRLTTLEKQVGAGYALLFPRKGTSDYVMTSGMPSLKAVTFCLWMKTADTGNEGVTLSYAVSGGDNELSLVDYRNFMLWVGNSHSEKSSVSANDGKWHHICVTWEDSAGSWNLYKDGKIAASGKGLKTGHVISGGGTLILGQEQDSQGGSFDANQSVIGEMAGVNIWDHVINGQEIMRMSKSCLTGVGNVFKWRDFKDHVKGSVKIIYPSC